jgi:8-oxo-dGTP pyrophosphatase MutT (NUDIX family)
MERKTLSAGVIVARREGGSWCYLLLRVYTYWDFPKGIVEPGEDPKQTARREVEEETGLKDLTFVWGHDYRETPPYGRGKVARYYTAETRQSQVVLPVSPELKRPEHHEARWVTYEEARRLVSPRVIPILDWANTVVTGKEIPAPPETG